ncbi:hypothetical protein Tco_1113258 [Tanacetum coccineum]|uniref:Uncharacterized protein n=1 Tax=Tanacetum coccineum TaxID=301880 RepID=A0ABQ5IT66_9ASTR
MRTSEDSRRLHYSALSSPFGGLPNHLPDYVLGPELPPFTRLCSLSLSFPVTLREDPVTTVGLEQGVYVVRSMALCSIGGVLSILVMFSPTRKKSCWGTIFPTGLERYKEPLVEQRDRIVDRLSDARSRTGPAESSDSCGGKIKPKRVVYVIRSMALCSIGGVYVVRSMALCSIRGVLRYDPEKDDDVDIEEDEEEEEEEHPAPADSTTVALPAVDQAPSAEETELFETDESAATAPPHPAYRVTASISIQDEPPIPFWYDTEVARLLAIPTLPPSPLSLWSSPLPQIPSPPLPLILSPLPVSLPLHVSSPPPASPICPLGYRAAMIRLRAKALSTSHSLLLPPPIILSHTRSDAPSSGTPPLLPIPLPTSSPHLHLLSTNRRADGPDVTLPPRKRLGIALGLRYEVGESSSAPTARPPGGFRADYGFVATIDREIMRDLERDVSYGIIDTWDEILVDRPGVPATDDTELDRWMIEFTTRVRQDTDEIYTRLDDEQTERQLMAGQLNMLYRDRRTHARTARLIEAEARMSREASGRSMYASDLVRSEVMALRTHVVAQQAQFIEALKLPKRLQTQMTEFERQQGPAKVPTQPDAPEEAGSSS